jgi:regulator of cell morphogenesis and NO signaling
MLLLGLAELEGDMHRHVHEENNILFPRAAAREAELSTTLRAEDHAGLDRS